MRGEFLHNQRSENGCSRRKFLGYAGGALAAGALSSSLAGETPPGHSPADRSAQAPDTGRPALIWANLLHLSFNMWCDRPVESGDPRSRENASRYYPRLRFDDKLWEELTKRMADAGMNMVVIDLGDGVRYQSHPEIAVEGAWPVERLRTELARLRKLGLEPIPKMNFSATHDAWLGVYCRQVSTPIYYRVCTDLIDEVIRLFDKPRFFHLGYDEETAECQRSFAYTVVRQYELWWHDFEFFVKEVERRGVRPWIWSDYVWKHSEEFFKRMPKSVLQSNWYYGLDFRASGWYGELERHGYDQVPTGSNCENPRNFGLTVAHCRKWIAPARLKGFLQTPWFPTVENFRQLHVEAIDQVAAAMAAYAREST
jgi:hypothetical protein